MPWSEFSGRPFCRYRVASLVRSTRWSPPNGFFNVRRCASGRLDPKPDIVYGHFLYSGGAAAVEIGKHMAIPLFVAVGEGTFWSVEPLGFARAKRDFQGARGVLAVSSVLRLRLIAELDIPDGKIGVFPNGIDPGLFYPRNRHDMRKKCGCRWTRSSWFTSAIFWPRRGLLKSQGQ